MVNNSVESNFSEIKKRIAGACAACGRKTSEVRLIAVSKRQPIEKIRSAVAAGHRCFGENQVQEAVAKAAELPADLEWHMIGPLQGNKVKAAARLFDVVHSLDRPKIAHLLNKELAKLGRRIDVFVQVNLGAEVSKHGYSETSFETDVRGLVELEQLRLVGLMAIPPFEEQASEARQWFRKLRHLRDEVESWPEWSEFRGGLSMGMSHDFEIAIEEGATHIRVGTDIFGSRPNMPGSNTGPGLPG